jgi:aminoglycoside phosphotransferase (APT) family kinase protein
MVSRLMAHLVVRAQTAQAANADNEVKALLSEEAAEDELLATLNGEATEGELSAETLKSYLQSRLGDPAIEIGSIDAPLGGFSKQTLIVTLHGAERVDNALVIRRDQEGSPVASVAADELPIIALMHRHGVPVAEPLWADKETAFGSILVMRRVHGTPAFDLTASSLGSTPRTAALALAKVLAQIHSVPVKEVDWVGEDVNLRVQEHVARMVAGFERQWQSHRVANSPLIEAAFAYLRANVPATSPGPVIVHGDASLRNLLIREGQATALLDWELWHIGDPTEDLAYCRPDIEQVVPWQEFMAEYKSHGGCDYDDRIGAYYGLFGAVRNVVFGHSCLHGFSRAPKPETRMAFAPVYLARKLMPDVARRLESLTSS